MAPNKIKVSTQQHLYKRKVANKSALRMPQEYSDSDEEDTQLTQPLNDDKELSNLIQLYENHMKKKIQKKRKLEPDFKIKFDNFNDDLSKEILKTEKELFSNIHQIRERTENFLLAKQNLKEIKNFYLDNKLKIQEKLFKELLLKKKKEVKFSSCDYEKKLDLKCEENVEMFAKLVKKLF
ncbi:hypothetical protein HK099_002922 [Clydaea vesicula]|uniref:Uncharacterized protein n=1 Tax=Clydaea vesicula TaxID=447962 RepID=A0AAD5XYV5_9FUNG|nr:hypothetical protein HK099_002922 [Clydaea vesicula]